jgi:hypothetical protein
VSPPTAPARQQAPVLGWQPLVIDCRDVSCVSVPRAWLQHAVHGLGDSCPYLTAGDGLWGARTDASGLNIAAQKDPQVGTFLKITGGLWWKVCGVLFDDGMLLAVRTLSASCACI